MYVYLEAIPALSFHETYLIWPLKERKQSSSIGKIRQVILQNIIIITLYARAWWHCEEFMKNNLIKSRIVTIVDDQRKIKISNDHNRRWIIRKDPRISTRKLYGKVAEEFQNNLAPKRSTEQSIDMAFYFKDRCVFFY